MNPASSQQSAMGALRRFLASPSTRLPSGTSRLFILYLYYSSDIYLLYTFWLIDPQPLFPLVECRSWPLKSRALKETSFFSRVGHGDSAAITCFALNQAAQRPLLAFLRWSLLWAQTPMKLHFSHDLVLTMEFLFRPFQWGTGTRRASSASPSTRQPSGTSFVHLLIDPLSEEDSRCRIDNKTNVQRIHHTRRKNVPDSFRQIFCTGSNDI
jgi:hypothetical protein